MGKIMQIEDEHSWLCGVRLRNGRVVSWLALLQLFVTIVSLAQHVFSLIHFRKIFLCSFNETLSLQRTDEFSSFLSYDVIIFDFGLFHELIHVQECIANYLDGGYMRCLWCIGQVLATLGLLFLPCFTKQPHPLMLWPILIVQNSYCFGLMILTIATADKFLVSLLSPLNGHVNIRILVFFVGTLTNHFLNYVLWHYYWHIEADFKERTGLDVVPFWV